MKKVIIGGAEYVASQPAQSVGDGTYCVVSSDAVVIEGNEYVPKAEGKAEVKEWPQHGDQAWYVSIFGVRSDRYNENDVSDRLLLKQLFPTEKEAEQEALRRKCMATRWVPEDGESFYIFDMYGQGVLKPSPFNPKDHAYLADVLLGLAAPTKSEAQARWDKYGDAWMAVLTPKK